MATPRRKPAPGLSLSATPTASRTGLVRGEPVMDELGLREFSVASIADNPDNPVDRTSTKVGVLAGSMGALGLLQPLLLVTRGAWIAAHPDAVDHIPASAEFVVVDGHRRLVAARESGTVTVPAMVRDELADQMDEAMLAAARQRLALTPIQEAAALKRALDAGKTVRALAAAVGVSPGQISKRVKLLTLPEAIQAGVGAGVWPVIDALTLLDRVDGDTELLELVVEVITEADPIAPDAADEDTDIETERNRPRLLEHLEEARHRLRLRQATDAAQARAVELGAEFAPDAGKRLGAGYYNRELHGSQAIEKAQQAGALVITPAPWVQGQVRYFTTAKPTTTGPAKKAGDPRLAPKARKAAADARAPFVTALADRKPTQAEFRQAATAFLVGRLSADYRAWNTTSPWWIAKHPEAAAHGWGAETDPTDREALMWGLYVHAAAEHLAAAPPEYQPRWDADDARFLALLQKHGYELQPYDEARLEEAAPHSPTIQSLYPAYQSREDQS